MRILSLSLLFGCISPASDGDCPSGKYRTIRGVCVDHVAVGGDSGVPGETDADTDTDADADTDADTDTVVAQSVTASCTDTSWYLDVTSIAGIVAASIDIRSTGGDDSEEYHTMGVTEGEANAFERTLFIHDSYFENTTTVFSCDSDGTNPDLTWRFTAYQDEGHGLTVGCVAWGDDPSVYTVTGCAEIIAR